MHAAFLSLSPNMFLSFPYVLMSCTDIPITQHGLPYMWAVIIPAFANLAWGIVVWATVPARPEQASVLSFYCFENDK